MSDMQNFVRQSRSLFLSVGMSRSLMIGAVITLLLLGLAVVSLVWTPYSPTGINILHKLQGPSALHWLGTDALGRDVLSMIMVGARNSLSVALIAVAVGMGIGVPLGAYAAAQGGLIDGFVMRMTDLALAFPALLTAVIITAIFGGGAVNAMIAIGIFNIPVFARVTRGASMGLWKRDYVLAARCAGRGDVATYCAVRGIPFEMDWSARYIGALWYLVIPGSVIGFTAYLTLVGRMGPERAAYCTVLFPVVALNVSAFVEGYQWTAPALLGLVLVMAGNVLVFRKPKVVNAVLKAQHI